MEWYSIRNAETLDTPALVIYPDRVKRNIDLLKTFVTSEAQLRPHIKTNKCPQVCRMMLEEGITKFKCATIAEAEMLAMERAPDVLLAYQPGGPKGRRFFELQRTYPGTVFSCLVDNAKSLSELSALADTYRQKVRLFIDVNVGMNRTGIRPGKEAWQLYIDGTKLPGIQMAGLHAYDGHIRDADLTLRKKHCDDAFAPLNILWKEIAEATGKIPMVVAGGTPTFPIHAKRKDVEVSPGTFIFWDKGYQQALSEQPFEFAALVVTRVISRPDDETLCLDLGHKSIASENPLANRVYFLNAPELQPTGHSEEHLVVRTKKNHPYQVGDLLYGVPHHICPTVALYDEAGVCLNNLVSETWPILARKRKITV